MFALRQRFQWQILTRLPLGNSGISSRSYTVKKKLTHKLRMEQGLRLADVGNWNAEGKTGGEETQKDKRSNSDDSKSNKSSSLQKPRLLTRRINLSSAKNGSPTATSTSTASSTFAKDDDNEDNEETEADRPFTLPPGQFRPKQSLGQNFLSDQNYVLKICDELKDDSEGGRRIIEIGPGPGALSRVLIQRYPQMTAIELDQRAVAFLGQKLPQLKVIHEDVLNVNWPEMAMERNGPISIIANLPYYIVSQVLFSLADSHKAIKQAIVTMQLEVADRITAQPSTKDYGIPSVVFQLYSQPRKVFNIPPSVFFPKPKVDSALLALDFTKPHPRLHTVDGNNLRKVVSIAFRQRRKMMRQSLKDLIVQEGLHIPDKWATKRPEELRPEQFIDLTFDLFGGRDSTANTPLDGTTTSRSDDSNPSQSIYFSKPIWRTSGIVGEMENKKR